MYDSIYHNNAIEGNSLSREEVQQVLLHNEVVAGKPLSDHLSIVGYRDAFLLAQRLAETRTRISEHEIKKLHYKMLIDQQDVSGEYRSYNLMIHGHRPTSYEKVPYKMLQLVESSCGEDQHPLEWVAFYHLRFEKIHPFGDGNGRVGRLLLNILLEQNGYPPIIVKAEDKQRYYEGLQAYDGLDGNPRVEPMQLLVAELVCRQLDELLVL
ncbi:MAG: Fic family protein [Coriobacteriales bacterium]|nr:Fic family protein [Coriobacteriales bacterium]